MRELWQSFKKYKHKAKFIYFLLRWGLIGKYHCDLPRNRKIGYYANKICWSLIAFCFIYTTAKLLLGA